MTQRLWGHAERYAAGPEEINSTGFETNFSFPSDHTVSTEHQPITTDMIRYAHRSPVAFSLSFGLRRYITMRYTTATHLPIPPERGPPSGNAGVGGREAGNVGERVHDAMRLRPASLNGNGQVGGGNSGSNGRSGDRSGEREGKVVLAAIR